VVRIPYCVSTTYETRNTEYETHFTVYTFSTFTMLS